MRVDSEEVVLKNASEIPQGMIRIERPDAVSMYGKNEGSYRVGMKFLGLIRMKDIQVEVVDGSYAIPCGMPVGIYLKSKGVMVIGTGQITNGYGKRCGTCLRALKVRRLYPDGGRRRSGR